MGLGILLPLLAWVANGVLIQVARVKKWQDTLSEEDAHIYLEDEKPNLTSFRSFFHEYRWELILGLVVVLILIYAIVFASPRLTGKIPIDPGLPGRPFNNFRWLRAFLSENYDSVSIWISFLSILAWLGVLIRALLQRSSQGLQTSFIVASLTLAGLGQFALNGETPQQGWSLYACAIIGFLYWGWMVRRRLTRHLDTYHVSRFTELFIVLILFILTAFNRLYVLPYVPYGYEGDETKWISEAVNLGVRGLPDASGEYHRDSLPVSFYMQAPFQQLFSPGILTARACVAFFSILGTLAFYWLIRQIAPVPLAALAAYLLSNSIFDISASRLANVESHVKLWPILTLAVLVVAVHTRKWQVFGLCGLALAVGMLTYDTVWPIIVVVLILASIELIHIKVGKKESVYCLTALLTPTALVLPLLIPYMTSRLPYYDISSKGWADGSISTISAHLVSVLQSWFRYTPPDFLYNRNGPLINALLLPWLVLGFTLAIVLFRIQLASWMLVWAFLFIFPIPILTNSSLGRVYYPGLPSIYALIALGMFLFWKELAIFIGKILRPALIIAVIVPLIWLPILNLYIYFNEVPDPQDSQIRREIGDLVNKVASQQTLILLPIIPGANEPLQNEYKIIELSLITNLASENITQAYQSISFDTLLPALTIKYSQESNLAIFLDKVTPIRREQRDAMITTLIRCFPNGTLIEGTFFDVYQMSAEDRDNTSCLPVTVTLNSASPQFLNWSLSNGNASEVKLICERELSKYIKLEAEDFPPGPFWQVEDQYTEGWIGQGYLMDNLLSQSTSFDFQYNSDQDVYVWIRFYKRAEDNSPGIFGLNNQKSKFADIHEDKLNQWIWERIGPFPIHKGKNILSLSRPYIDDPSRFMALFIDTIILTHEHDFKPDNVSRETLPVHISSYPIAQRDGSLSIALKSGKYHCQIEVNSALPLVDAFGQSPVYSNPIDFVIQP